MTNCQSERLKYHIGIAFRTAQNDPAAFKPRKKLHGGKHYVSRQNLLRICSKTAPGISEDSLLSA